MVEMQEDSFAVVGAAYRRRDARRDAARRRKRGVPHLSILLLTLIVLGCVFADQIANHDPASFALRHLNEAPNGQFYFGTDALGRDLFSIVWYGGRVSLIVGLLGTAVLTVIGVVYGCVSGCASGAVDAVMMRTAELLGSIPVMLILLLILSLLDEPTPVSLALAIGATGWLNLARIVRGEVRQIRRSEYVLAARAMGAGFFRILWNHLMPNFVSAILFMVVSSVGSCIIMESTLSFLGLGLPVAVVSWGSMLSLANRALLTNAWWVILIPGAFMVGTLLCITNIAHFLRREADRKCSNL